MAASALYQNEPRALYAPHKNVPVTLGNPMWNPHHEYYTSVYHPYMNHHPYQHHPYQHHPYQHHPWSYYPEVAMMHPTAYPIRNRPIEGYSRALLSHPMESYRGMLPHHMENNRPMIQHPMENNPLYRPIPL